MAGVKRELVKLRGSVEERVVQKGTASEHKGVLLVCEDGRTVRLVRQGGNPFRDETTRALIGNVVEAEGYLIGNELRYVSAKLG